jgi:hypothetical protein
MHEHQPGCCIHCDSRACSTSTNDQQIKRLIWARGAESSNLLLPGGNSSSKHDVLALLLLRRVEQDASTGT